MTDVTYEGDDLAVVVRGRQGGKTTELLQRLKDDPETALLVADEGRRLEARRLVTRLGMTAHEADKRILVWNGRDVPLQLRGSFYRKALVDDVDTVLRSMLAGLELAGLSVYGSIG